MSEKLANAVACAMEDVMMPDIAERPQYWLLRASELSHELTKRGFAIVPREPTEAMCTHGHVAMGAALIRGESRLERQAAGYRAMISATNTGKGGA